MIKGKHGQFQFFNKDFFIGKSLKEYGEYSEIELQLLLNFIKKGDIVLDVGSNIGSFTIPFSKKVGNTGKVLAFEPQPEVFKLLKKNIQLNHSTNIQSFQIGLGNNNETVKLKKIKYNEVGNFGGVSLKNIQKNSKAFLSDNDFFKVNIYKLDEINIIKKCHFIKIDVEGMEVEVLEGAKKIISKHRPILFLENDFSTPNKLNRYLLDNDYDIFWVITSLFNKDNFFSNNKNFFIGENDLILASYNIIGFPKEKKVKIHLQKIENGSTLPSEIYLKYIN